MSNLPVDLKAYVDRLIEKRDVPLADALALAGDGEEYLRVFATKAAVQATVHLPEIIDVQAQKAKDGDTKAANFIAEIARVTQKKGVQVAAQFNLFGPGEKEKLKEEVIEADWHE